MFDLVELRKRYVTPQIDKQVFQQYQYTVPQQDWVLQVLAYLHQKIPTLDCFIDAHGNVAGFRMGVKPLNKQGPQLLHVSKLKSKSQLCIRFYRGQEVAELLATRIGDNLYKQSDADPSLTEAFAWIDRCVEVLNEIQVSHPELQKYIRGHGYLPTQYPEHPLRKSASVTLQPPVNLHPTTNQILYGAAGTGKTYALQQLQLDYTKTLATQDQETFLAEKLRNRSWAEVIALVFLEEKRSLKVPEIIEHPCFLAKFKQLGRTANISQAAWGTLQRHAPKNSKTVKYSVDRRSDLALFDKDSASLWHLIEADNEDYLTELRQLLRSIQDGAQQGDTIQRYRFVTFHQSYSYEDFIEGLRPVLADDERMADSPSDGQVRYHIKQGAFVELCERARQDPTHQYAMFIDEINRGNVSKIFGELISLIELDKRAGCANALSVTLPYSTQSFSVPANVSIYGTMNSADRSLTPLDTALRRRFAFVEFLPDPELLAKRELDGQTYTAEVEGINLAGLLDMLNERIEILLGRDYVLGHAYFWSVTSLADLKKIMRNKIIPQLQEHCFEDWDKVRLILADTQKQDAARQFIQLKTTDPSKLQRIFGDITVPVVPSYQVNPWLMLDGLAEDVFVQPETYWAMY